MVKRKYNFKAILLIYLIGFILISLITSNLKSNSLVNIISNIIGGIGQFIIARGLITNRMGSSRDYIDNIKHINLNMIFIHIVIFALTSLIGFLSGFGAILFVGSQEIPNLFDSLEKIIISGIFAIILLILVSLLFAYAYFVVSDPRNSEDSIFESLKKTLYLGKQKIGKTFILMFKKFLLPFIIYLILMFVILFANDSYYPGPNITILSIIIAIYIVYAVVSFMADLSNHYLDYTGDLETNDYLYLTENSSESSSLTMTRKIENESISYDVEKDLSSYDNQEAFEDSDNSEYED